MYVVSLACVFGDAVVYVKSVHTRDPIMLYDMALHDTSATY